MVSSGSPVTVVKRRLSSVKNSRPDLLMGPSVSNAMGTKLCVEGKSAYFAFFRVSANSAAAPGVVDVR